MIGRLLLRFVNISLSYARPVGHSSWIMVVIIKLCPRGAHTCARTLFRCCDLDINPITLKLECDLDILKVYFHAENEVAKLRHSKHLTVDGWDVHGKWKKIRKCLSGSNITDFQSLLTFTMGRIPTKLHRFPTSSFRDFQRTDTQTDTQTPP